jgi:hypothetical protein
MGELGENGRAFRGSVQERTLRWRSWSALFGGLFMEGDDFNAAAIPVPHLPNAERSICKAAQAVGWEIFNPTPTRLTFACARTERYA